MFDNISLRKTLIMMLKVAICYYIYTIAPESRFVDSHNADYVTHSIKLKRFSQVRPPFSLPLAPRRLRHIA
jgi:hypothetical protein